MDGMRGCMEGTFSLSLLYFFLVLPRPPPPSRHACLHDESNPFATLPHEWPYSRYRFAAAQQPHCAAPPLALSALYPDRSAAEAGSFLFCVYILGDRLLVVYFC